MKRALLLLVGLALAQGCRYSVDDIPSAPANPTFSHDILALLADHCLLCHSAPPARGAPDVLRLDVYADTGGIKGAKSEAQRMLIRVQTDTMPPGAGTGDGLGPNGRQALQNWVDTGTPE